MDRDGLKAATVAIGWKAFLDLQVTIDEMIAEATPYWDFDAVLKQLDG